MDGPHTPAAAWSAEHKHKEEEDLSVQTMSVRIAHILNQVHTLSFSFGCCCFSNSSSAVMSAAS